MEIKKWRGLRNTTTPERFAPGELATASDVDIDNSGRLLSRQGFTEINSTACHSLYSDQTRSLIMQGAVLRLINPDLSLTTLTTLSNTSPVSYMTVNGVTYFSNGVDTGRIQGSTALPWGIDPPIGQPAASAVSGSLQPGTYLYALTFTRAGGFESGTGVAGVIDLPTGGGIQFTGVEVSTNPEVSGKILYLSTPNGETLYRAMELTNGATTAVYRNPAEQLTIPLATQFVTPPPAGTMVREYNGTAYVVVGNTIYYSDAYDFESFRMDKQFLQLPTDVSMFECVNGGVYLGTLDTSDKETGAIWYLSGERPDTFRWMKLYDYGVIPGTAVKTEAAYFQPPSPNDPVWSRPAVVWATRHGACVGYDNGQATNITETRYSFPSAQGGAGMVRQTKGFAQYIAVLRGAGTAHNSAP